MGNEETFTTSTTVATVAPKDLDDNDLGVVMPPKPEFVPEPTSPKAQEGDIECSLCQKKVKVLEKRGRTIACADCIGKIVMPIQLPTPKIGRNDPCFCGKKDDSGKPMKYKKCCGKGK